MPTSSLRFFGVAALLVAAACTSNKNLEQDSPQVSAEVVAPTPPTARPTKAPRLAQLDTAHFSPQFIRSFQETNKAETSFDVHGGWLLLSPTDSVAFPVAELPANAPVVYAATDKGRAYRLTLTRRNYSTVHYVAEARQGGKLLSRQTGLADLSPSFFADIEIPKDSETGLPYSGYEFVAIAPQQKGFAVLIGRSQDADKAQVYGGTQPQQSAWHNLPTLRRQR